MTRVFRSHCETIVAIRPRSLILRELSTRLGLKMTEPPTTPGSVLLRFSAQNVRSFRDDFELSLLATKLADDRVKRRVRWREGAKVDVLPSAGIFGANASGKSNVLRAMSDMQQMVLHSFRRGSPTGGLPQRPFLLDSFSRERGSRFEIELILHGVRHQYGFELDGHEVIEEWALNYPRGRPASVFHREREEVSLGTSVRVKGRAVLDLLRPNALFLSTAAAANHPTLLPLYAWFQRNLLLAEARSREVRQALTTTMFDDPTMRKKVLRLLRAADLGISNAEKHEIDEAMRERLERAVGILLGDEDADAVATAANIDAFGIGLVHQGSDGPVEFSPDDESLGTLVWFGLVGPVIQALVDGAVLLADELDASLHPALVKELVRLFQDPHSNPLRAQLIFNSHDTTLLGTSVGDRPLGRDQIWFTEKHEDGATRLYPLSDLDPRRDEAIEKRYLAGRYGGVPVLARTQFDTVEDQATAFNGDGCR